MDIKALETKIEEEYKKGEPISSDEICENLYSLSLDLPKVASCETIEETECRIIMMAGLFAYKAYERIKQLEDAIDVFKGELVNNEDK